MYNVNIVDIVNIVLWTHFYLSNVTQSEVEDLRKLAPAQTFPSTN